MPYKAVIFDMGGVIIKYIHQDKYLSFMMSAKQDAEKREKFMQFERGEISVEEIIDLLEEVFNPEIEIENFEDAIFSRYMGERDPYITSAIAKLKQNGYKVALLTNNGYWSPSKQRSTIIEDCDEVFDEVVESCRVGCRKPEKKIYQIMLDKLKLKPEECIFIDDLASNVEAAEKMGITGLVLENADGKAVVDKLGKLIGLKLY